MSQQHVCQPPDLSRAGVDYDDDWECPDCGQEWYVGFKNLCHDCYRHDGRQWEKYGTGDGTFPLVQASRGGIQFPRHGSGDDPQ